MIGISTAEGRDRPVVVCDVCKEQITDSARANVFFERAENGHSDKLWFCHQGKCDEILKPTVKSNPFINLDRVLTFLCSNSGLRPERMIEISKLNEQFGI